MNGKFFLAAIPEPHTVLGLRLRPFSAGHIILLHRSGNAFVTGQEPDEAHLAAAVYICAQSYEQGLASWDDPKTPGFMERWGKKIGKFDLQEKVARFVEYLNAGSTIPTYSETDGSTSNRCLDVPTVQIVKCTLMLSFGGMSESEFLNRPWGLSLWDFVTIKGIRGAVDIFNDEKIAEAKAFADALAAKLNGGGNG